MKQHDIKPYIGEGPFYTEYYGELIEEHPEYSLQDCNWNETMYPNLAEHKNRLIDRFDNTYKFREIGQETPGRFKHYLQMRLDEVAEHYDHMYKVFKENNVDELGTGYTDNETHKLERKTSDIIQTNNTTNSTFKDTPIAGRINNPTNESEDTTIGNDNATGTQNDTYTNTKTRIQHDEHMVDELNRLADRYKSIDNEFVESFNEMFMGIAFTEEYNGYTEYYTDY